MYGMGKLFGKMTKDIGIDLGTANVLVYVQDKGIVLCEPSVVAIDTTTDRVVRVGKEAADMMGRTPENIVAIRPLKDGVVSQYDVTLKMLQYFIRRACGSTLFPPRVLICVSSGITEVEERAVVEASKEAGARKTYLLEEPLAAAVGAGVDVTKADGQMIVNIGGGTTEIAVISFGGIVVSESIRIGGDKFDEAIMHYVRRKYNMLIGERMAETIKLEIGMVYDHRQTMEMEVKGRDLTEGMPQVIVMNSREMMEAMMEPITAILDAICSVIERTPPELVGDILHRGIMMTGGGSKLWGLDRLIEKVTGVPTRLAKDPETCVVRGAGKMMETMGKLPEGIINISKEKMNRY